MPKEMPGRRIPFTDNHFEVGMLEQAGDYLGPITGYTGEKPAVFFLLPIARDEGVDPGARSIHHVTMPPHVFTEEPDGTLTITASIGAYGHKIEDGHVWHGYLTRGNWVLA